MSAGRVRVRVATCAALPEPDADAEPLAAAFARAGVDAQLLAWDDPRADWDAALPTVIRSTWNYAQAPDAFAAWIDRAAAAGPLWNPPAIARWNMRKRYLPELAARGVAIAPTTLVERGEHATCDLRAASGGGRFVIKPEVGAGSWMTRAFDRADDPEAAAFLHELTADRAALVQPYVASVDDYGERSLVWIDGELSHAIRKAPRFAGGVERTTGPHPIADDERALADAALAPFIASEGTLASSAAEWRCGSIDQLLYARCDIARDADGRPMIMELELVEPSLFFARQPGAADRYVAGLLRRLRA